MKIRRKKITIDNGIVFTDCLCQNSVEFTADIPRNAVVHCVRVNGKTLDNYALNGVLTYPKEVYFESKAVVAIVRFPEGASNEELYQLAQAAELNDFEVEYLEGYVAEI